MPGLAGMDNLKTPCGCILFTGLSLSAVILITVGLLGMFRGWGPIDLFTVMFTVGVMCAGLNCMAIVCMAVSYCFS